MRIALLIPLLVALCGCGTDSGLYLLDDPEFGDADGDSVCNATEFDWGTDPELADTDGDGFADGVELMLSYDALRSSSPDREEVIFLGGSETSFVINHAVFGGGEDYFGSVESDPTRDPDRIRAVDFVSRQIALGANPVENVAQVDDGSPSFRAVVGRTLLSFEIGIDFPPGVQMLDCHRAYPFRFVVKRNDGTVVGSQRFTIVAMAAGERQIEADRWCDLGPCF